MELDIDKELAICEAAPPGPWTKRPHYAGCVRSCGDELVPEDGFNCPEAMCLGDMECAALDGPSADFIVAARTGYPEALRRLKRLREIIEGCTGSDGRLCIRVADVLEIREQLNL